MINAIIFLFIQAMIINGVHQSFKGYKVTDPTNGEVTYHGMIFYLLFAYKWDKENWWHKPLYSCVKCMASVWGFVTFWPTVLYIFGFELWQIPLYTADVFALVYLNWIFYKLT